MAPIGQDASQLSPARRRSLFVASLGLLAPLLVAGWLRPDPTGFGTHRQLGLPPCTFVWLFGVRCPSCGMTTSWSHAVRGQWKQALGSNVGGTVLAATAMMIAPWLLVSAVRGRWLLGRPDDRALALAAAALIGVTLLDWIFRLATQG